MNNPDDMDMDEITVEFTPEGPIVTGSASERAKQFARDSDFFKRVCQHMKEAAKARSVLPDESRIVDEGEET